MASGQFHSVLTNAGLPAPLTGIPGDVWFVNATGLLWFVDGTGSVIQLLTAVPIPTIGPQGPAGPAGSPGLDFIGQTNFVGSWLPSPQTYPVASVVSFGGFLYLAKAILQIGDNVQNPQHNGAFWQVLGPVNTTRTSAAVVFVDGQGIPLSAPSNHGVFSFPFTGTITGWSLVADVPGSAVMDILWASYANFPGNLVSICGGNNPSLSGQQKNEVLDVSALFTKTSFVQGDQIQFVLDSASSITQLTLTLILSATN